MRLIDLLVVASKLLLLCLWLVPLLWYLGSILLPSFADLSSDIFYDLAFMLLVLVLAIIPATATAYSLSYFSVILLAWLFLPWLFAMLVPEQTVLSLIETVNVTIQINQFWYQLFEQWFKLYPLAVLITLISIKRIDNGMFDLAQLSNLAVVELIYKYFLPLLSPLLLLTILLAISPVLYYHDSDKRILWQVTQFLFSLPLLILVYNSTSKNQS